MALRLREIIVPRHVHVWDNPAKIGGSFVARKSAAVHALLMATMNTASNLTAALELALDADALQAALAAWQHVAAGRRTARALLAQAAADGIAVEASDETYEPCADASFAGL